MTKDTTMNPLKDAEPLASKPARVTDRILRILLALSYVMAGIMKWAGAEVSVTTFEAIGFGQWFRYFTGALEFACGILILFPRFAFVSAATLACVMIGALFTHYMVGGDAIPASVLLVFNLIVMWLRRDRIGLTPSSASAVKHTL
jgi:putative oxidoreductase